jgi:hypothetical protein
LRCLREDLKLQIPPIDELLEDVEHPLLAKAHEQFAGPETSRERIRAIDDQVISRSKSSAGVGGVDQGGPAVAGRGGVARSWQR